MTDAVANDDHEEGPLFQYIAAVESGAMEADIHQAKIAEQLQNLFEQLRDYEPPSLEYFDELKRKEEERKERIEEKERQWRKERAGKKGRVDVFCLLLRLGQKYE